MDVTRDYNQRYDTYGGSRNTGQQYVSANKSLQYANQGSNISDATLEKVTVIPAEITYKDTVGLFGVENVYIKLDLKIKNYAYEQPEVIVNDYYDPVLTDNDNPLVNTYEQGFINNFDDITIVNTYEPARISNTLPQFVDPLVSIDLKNLKTGNKYIDSWLDVRIYNREKIEHPYDRIYISPNSYCYLGFHARNTKRLPYNIKTIIGEVYIDGIDLPASERQFVYRG